MCRCWRLHLSCWQGFTSVCRITLCNTSPELVCVEFQTFAKQAMQSYQLQEPSTWKDALHLFMTLTEEYTLTSEYVCITWQYTHFILICISVVILLLRVLLLYFKTAQVQKTLPPIYNLIHGSGSLKDLHLLFNSLCLRSTDTYSHVLVFVTHQFFESVNHGSGVSSVVKEWGNCRRYDWSALFWGYHQ